jgi:SGNH hydrolase-like domain, acetyltransferase AlgX
MKKTFFTTWIITILFLIFVIVGSHNKDLGRKLLYHKDGKFDIAGLYQESKLEDFKEFILRADKPLNTKLDEADIIAFGDSFVDVSLGSPSFAAELEEKVKRPVFLRVDFAEFGREPVNFNPLDFLRKTGYKKGKKKYMVLETVERFSIRNAKGYKDTSKSPIKKGRFERIVEALSWRMAAFDDWARKHLIFLNNDNYDLKYFFHENIFLYRLNYWIANIRFKVLGEVDPVIGAYSLKHKMLFYKESVEFDKRPKTEEELNQMVENIVYLSNELKDKYNIELIYVIVPNKNSIYNDYINRRYQYDEFIPKVNKRLIQKGVNTVDLYSAYMKQRRRDDSELLYFRADEHFDPLGKSIMVNLVSERLLFF